MADENVALNLLSGFLRGVGESQELRLARQKEKRFERQLDISANFRQQTLNLQKRRVELEEERFRLAGGPTTSERRSRITAFNSLINNIDKARDPQTRSALIAQLNDPQFDEIKLGAGVGATSEQFVDEPIDPKTFLTGLDRFLVETDPEGAKRKFGLSTLPSTPTELAFGVTSGIIPAGIDEPQLIDTGKTGQGTPVFPTIKQLAQKKIERELGGEPKESEFIGEIGNQLSRFLNLDAQGRVKSIKEIPTPAEVEQLKRNLFDTFGDLHNLTEEQADNLVDSEIRSIFPPGSKPEDTRGIFLKLFHATPTGEDVGVFERRQAKQLQEQKSLDLENISDDALLNLIRKQK